jgi:hypothetical protein
MPTRCTNQLYLNPQQWQSSDQIEFTQARQKVKAQLTQLLIPLPQLTRRTSQETMLNTKRLRKISSKHLTLGNDHTDKVPRRIQNPGTTRPEQHLKTSSNSWDTESKLYPSDCTRATRLRVILSVTLISPSDSTRPRPLSLKVMYLFVTNRDET